jgi:hypothetical protein
VGVGELIGALSASDRGFLDEIHFVGMQDSRMTIKPVAIEQQKEAGSFAR